MSTGPKDPSHLDLDLDLDNRGRWAGQGRLPCVPCNLLRGARKRCDVLASGFVNNRDLAGARGRGGRGALRADPSPGAAEQ